MDNCKLDAKLKKKLRADNSQTAPCYTYNELKRYEQNCFIRHSIIGLITGSYLYLLVLLFLVLPESEGKFEVFRDQLSGLKFTTMILASVVLTYAIRFVSIFYLNPLLVLLLQTCSLLLAVFGTVHFQCDVDQPLLSRPPVTGAGHFPMFGLAAIEELLRMPADAMQMQLYELRCEQSVRRLNSVNLFSEFVGSALAIRLAWTV